MNSEATLLIVLVLLTVFLIVAIFKSDTKIQGPNDKPKVINKKAIKGGVSKPKPPSNPILHESNNILATQDLVKDSSGKTINIQVKPRTPSEPPANNVVAIGHPQPVNTTPEDSPFEVILVELTESIPDDFYFCAIDDSCIHVLDKHGEVIVDNFHYQRPLTISPETDRLLDILKSGTIAIDNIESYRTGCYYDCLARINSLYQVDVKWIKACSVEWEYAMMTGHFQRTRYIVAVSSIMKIEGLTRRDNSLDSHALNVLDTANFVLVNRNRVVFIDTVLERQWPVFNTRAAQFSALPDNCPVSTEWRTFYVDYKPIGELLTVIEDLIGHEAMAVYRFRVKHSPIPHIEGFILNSDDELIAYDDTVKCRNRGKPHKTISTLIEQGKPAPKRSLTFDVDPQQIERQLTEGDELRFKTTDLQSMQFNKTIRIEFLKDGSRAFTTLTASKQVLTAIHLAHHYDYVLSFKSVDYRYKLQLLTSNAK